MTIDTAVIESLRDFALANGEIAFNYLCTAALNGEAWAVERIAPTVRVWNSSAMAGKRTVLRLDAIRATDTTRPDGTIARSFEV